MEKLVFFISDLVKSVLPHTKYVPEHLKEGFLDDVCQYLYDMSPKRPDGMVQGEAGPFDNLFIVAQK